MIVSTVTAMVFFDLGSILKDQFNLTIPTALFPTTENKQILLERYVAFAKHNVAIHRGYRKSLIESIITSLCQNVEVRDSETHDPVSKLQETDFLLRRILIVQTSST